MSPALTHQPWEHPDRYDPHETAWTAGSEREPEHHRELLLALGPWDAADQRLDAADPSLDRVRDRVTLRGRAPDG